MDNLSKSLAEAIETAIIFLSKKSCWKWVLETEDVPNTIESLTKRLVTGDVSVHFGYK